MLILVIPVLDKEFAESAIKQYEHLVDGFELRLDYLIELKLDDIYTLRHMTSKPLIYTLRSERQGGKWREDEALRWQYLQQLCLTYPDFIDMEYDCPVEYFEWVKQNVPQVKIICSYHEFQPIPFSKQDLANKLKHIQYDVLKVAQYCETGMQALTLIQSMLDEFKQQSLCLIPMGEMGQFARVLGPVLGNYFDYVVIDHAFRTAPGQLTLDEILTIYHYRRLSQSTKVYALIGQPVAHSIGHLYHNQRFLELNYDAVYVKIDISSSDLTCAMEKIIDLNVQGLSVTMPHKKALSRILDVDLRSINTLNRIENNAWQAFNTDGMGALNAIQAINECRIKSVLIIGGGGAALAIAETFIHHDYRVYILNPRSPEVTDIPGVILNFDTHDYPDFGYVINTLPPVAYQNSGQCLELARLILKSKHIVMDIDYSCKSMFIKHAQHLGCKIVPGVEMFYAQAQEQLRIWLRS